jgi:hypothetical protein
MGEDGFLGLGKMGERDWRGGYSVAGLCSVALDGGSCVATVKDGTT